MPPPVQDQSDDESTGGSIPYDNNDTKDEKPEKDESDDEEENDDNDENGEMYTVEKIVGHEYIKTKLFLQVKWTGYDNPEDQTLEPEENMMEDAKEAVLEYYEAQGGRPQRTIKKRKSMAETKPAPDKTADPKKRRRSKAATEAEPEAEAETATPTADEKEVPDWVPKTKNWENDVKNVDTIIRDSESGNLLAFLQWKNGKKAKVSIETCYERCPQKMLAFYEQHLVFKEG
ncbi:hypothetical protein ASPWEDRAFT_177151 [Aspergillus wentii DTO 134E9]|uniref:Chromo domain-containing protein n=1 Tax=Aspergillus wentii DTO 134E9 TaxID=1073089 RepID=A0A1L9R6I1_ASPWE|nr:uncharacterized protein ASPWEDRAFT_177151 [Aspergillus wentii DTO 134E9]OJJ30493.1 hypothetical protein ASPWEDRAFT_177151 [Aspergillus wentii DTO 134E9]